MSIKKFYLVVLAVSAVMLAVGIGSRFSGIAHALPAAQTGVTVPYSGSLTDEAGVPVADGAYDFTFTLYAAETDGAPLWSETQEGVTVQSGSFITLLGSVNALPKEVLDSGARWLEVAVRGPEEAEFTLLSPRQELSASTAQAGLAAPANSLSCVHTHWGEVWSGSGNGLVLQGNSDTYATLYARDVSPNGGYAIYGRSYYGTGVGVYGESSSGTGMIGKTTVTTGDTTGVWGEVASSGTYARAVVGWATKTSGTNYGMWGESESSTGCGVYGRSPWIGVQGVAEGTGGATGVYGVSNNASCTTGLSGCRGVQGSSDKGYGVNGQTATGVGVYAYASGVAGVALRAEGQSGGNLIEAYHGPMFSDREFYVSDAGEVYADGNFHSGGADLAEMLPAVEGLEPGDVLVVGPDGQLALSSEAYQSTVVGVYSTNPGFVGGDGEETDLKGKIPLAVVGVVPVKASAENGPIQPGDLLVASSTPGHAMKAGSSPSVGTVIGKALESLESGTGVIQILVMLQ